MKPISSLDAHLGYWLRFVSNHVSHAFGQKLAARDVTAAEWVILRELYEPDAQPPSALAPSAQAPSALADRLGMTRGAISKLADRLVAKALITRTASVEDGRYQALALTQAGRALVPALAELADRNDAEFFGHLSPAERAGVEAVLKDLIRRHGVRAIPTE